MPGPALQLLLGLDWGASGHVVAVVGAVVVVVVEPGLQGSVEQGEVVDAAAVEMWSVELAQDGAVKAFTDRVVVRGAWRDPVVDQIQGGPGGSEVLAGELGSVVGQDSFEGDAVVAQGLLQVRQKRAGDRGGVSSLLCKWRSQRWLLIRSG